MARRQRNGRAGVARRSPAWLAEELPLGELPGRPPEFYAREWRQAAARARRAEDQAADARADQAEALRALLALGLSYRRIAALIGISFQRVGQLARDAGPRANG